MDNAILWPSMDRTGPRPSRIECSFDGALPGNQFGGREPMRIAFVIGDEEVVRQIPDLPTQHGTMRSNNIAEYTALIELLRTLHERDAQGSKQSYRISGDSQLVIRQVTGRYRVRQDHLQTLHAEVLRLAQGLDLEFREVPREESRAGRLLEDR